MQDISPDMELSWPSGLKDINAKGQKKKKWNSKDKPLVYSSACMLMSTCIYICVRVAAGKTHGLPVEIWQIRALR